MSLIDNVQTAEWCYEVLDSLEDKLTRLSSDVIILYTSGVYYNSEERAFDVRKRNVGQMINHRNSLVNLIKKRRDYVLGAFHFLSTDYIILNTDEFQTMHQRLHERLADDNAFKDAVKHDIGDREFTESNKRFILEEVVISHLIRQQRVSFPKNLIETESWRLIAYRDSPLRADAYQWNNDVLETFDNDNPFEQAQYNTDAEQVELLEATPS